MRWSIFTACAALAGSCASSRPAGEPVPHEPKQLRPGQIIVALAEDKPEALTAQKLAIAAEYGLVEVGSFPLRSVQLECVVFETGSAGPLPDVLERLSHDARVKLAQTNQVFHEESGVKLSYGAAQIHADTANLWKTGKGVRVAVIDTGVSAEHPGLSGRIVETKNFVEGGEASFAQDLHGTAVAGVIAARRDDKVGMLGIAPDAELLALKACWYPVAGGPKALCSSWTLAKAVDFAVQAGAQVVNMSLSGPSDGLLGKLLAKAQEHGVIVVAAAAEGAGSPGFPASAPGVIAVVASDSRGAVLLPAWTSRTFVMVAPGVEILTTVPGAGYDFVSGSSFAAAHVSGVVALLREGNPHLSAAAALTLLKETARPVGGDAVAQRAGLVDACAALARLLGNPNCS